MPAKALAPAAAGVKGGSHLCQPTRSSPALPCCSGDPHGEQEHGKEAPYAREGKRVQRPRTQPTNAPPPLRKFTVFVSSTFRDLKDERERVARSILRAGHIPCGMEQFPSTHERGWAVIKETIDVCDYFVVFVAGKYGRDIPGSCGSAHGVSGGRRRTLPRE